MALFITFEGGEGSGKSSAIKEITNYFNRKNIPFIVTREPGGTPIGEQIRNVILANNNNEMDIKTEALLFAASRRQHLIEKIWPALNNNTFVLCDRYLDSSLAYQGYARGLGIETVLEINKFATEDTYPDITFFFDVDVNIGLDRINKNQSREVNRLDLEKISFHENVRKGYLELSKMYPTRYVIIDASKPLEDVVNQCLNFLKERINDL